MCGEWRGNREHGLLTLNPITDAVIITNSIDVRFLYSSALFHSGSPQHYAKISYLKGRVRGNKICKRNFGNPNHSVMLVAVHSQVKPRILPTPDLKETLEIAFAL